MRIISGEWKGRKLQGSGTLRPTTDRVREALFDILGARLEGLFVDLFAGTGAVGLEAASRGARAVLVERDPDSLAALGLNREALGLPESVEVVEHDVQRFLKDPARHGVEGAALAVFADPPYDYAATEKLLRRIASSGLVDAETAVVLEHRADRSFGRKAPELERVRTETYGTTALSFYRRAQ